MLIVEDDSGAMRAIELLLRHSGFDAIVADTVRGAFEQLKQKPEWVILDLMLPDGSGVDVLKFIRDHRLPIRVVVTSGTGDDKLIADMTALKPEHYIVKPVEFSKLLSALRSDPFPA